jgi:hypothetical protein
MLITYDNFLPKTYIDHLEDYFVNHVKWSYVTKSSGDWAGKDAWINSSDSPMMCLVSYFQNETPGGKNLHDEESLVELRPMLWFLEKETGLEVKSIDRIKSNLYLKNESWHGDKHHPPHTDSGKPENLTLLYYVNDSDGPTYFYDTTISHPNPESGKVIAKIEPKKGTAVLFESARYHAGTLPKENDSRIVINIVFSANNFNFHEEAQK